MPGLVRKLLVFAAVDGLVLQPLSQRGQRPAPAVTIAYKDSKVLPSSTDGDEVRGPGKSFEAFGVVGVLTLGASESFLISITRRQQVAQILGKPIYVITEVALTPLGSRAKAESAIAHTHSGLENGMIDGHASEASDSDSDEDVAPAAIHDEIDEEPHTHVNTGPAKGGHKRSSSVAQDVIKRKGSYGRFTQNFFSKKGWNVDQRRNLGLSVSATDPEIPAPAEFNTLDGQQCTTEETSSDAASAEHKESDVINTLLPKLLRTTQILFGTSRSFFFSYDYDLTRSLANQRPKDSDLPLYTEVDPLFFWNQHVMKPFIDAHQTAFVLPLLQGFVGQRAFEMDTDPPKPAFGIDRNASSVIELTDFVPDAHLDPEPPNAQASSSARTSKDGRNTEKSFLLTLISRRSVKRAGLRYLRRGVDEEGNTANGVETEQILSDSTWTTSSKIHSFVQLRGSIPIFFSQTPYSFKPVPQIQHSVTTNDKAFKKHFDNVSHRYGKIQVASLVEKHGNEAIVGDEYEKSMTRLNQDRSADDSIGFEWFDFHAECRGMKFENVALLTDSLAEKLDAFGETIVQDGKFLARQSGVLRTNCMDCLDRTNVVQSACARRALELQLMDEGIDFALQVDQTGQFFNTLWADNGDAISKQYASTAALKGDFTRTRKRDYKGAITDMGLSISRFYSGIVNDYFSQAAIDFLLGNVTELVFEEFEANMMSADPGVSMQKMRQQAIDVSQKIVIEDEHEELIAGWTLLVPHAPNTIKTFPFEEAVLLLTDSALYATRFDWNIEKVISFERVDLAKITSLKYGTYITSTLSAAQADETRNVGFVVSYKAGTENISRVNTRSLSTTLPANAEIPAEAETAASQIATSFTNLISASRPAPPPDKVLAFKALPSRSAALKGEGETNMSEIESVEAICAEIERLVVPWSTVEAGTERKSIVVRSDVVSLAEARKSTGLLEQLGHSLKKLVWA